MRPLGVSMLMSMVFNIKYAACFASFTICNNMMYPVTGIAFNSYTIQRPASEQSSDSGLIFFSKNSYRYQERYS